MPVQLHDVKNVLMGLSISTKSTSDIKTIRSEIKAALDIIEMDYVVIDVEESTPNESIKAFINQKKQAAGEKMILSTKISYYEKNNKVPLSTIIYMLGVLLDNAIESGTKKEIFIKVSVISESVLISVSNEYNKKSDSDFEKMFQTGYSTKASPSNGYGLPHLKQVVTRYGGQIGLKYDYLKDQKCHYLTLLISVGYKI